MSNNFLIGCVGKPSAGKSSFLNAATDANAKVGNYPFTTIEPNHGVAYYQSPCPCAKYEKASLCNPRYGKCDHGTRHIPVKMLDVAGLVPGASEGRGLGNKFLDDLRQAHVLLHIIDVSGRTNEKGEETVGYDPMKDADWLQDEIHSWVFNNLWSKWGSIVRRHVATKSSAADTLQAQFSGYGTKPGQTQAALDLAGVKEPAGMEGWDEAMVRTVVSAFLEVRFPTILVLNKIDHPDADANIAKMCSKYDSDKIVLSSALAECFLRKMRKENYIAYTEGSETFYTSDDPPPDGPANPPLRTLDDKIRARLDKIRDLVLFRYGATGVQDAIKRAVDSRQLVPVYPVKNLHNFTSDGKGVFRDCMLLECGTTVREFCHALSPEMEKHFLYAEGVSGQRMGEDEVLVRDNNIIKFTTAASEKDDVTHKPPPAKPVSSKPKAKAKDDQE
eukprot:TRINITY_DN26527_c0_g1_i1.p1 TRINITY_DN26527_c0_g1~~TRINITY_DN26527_c0_g1_i1.p1  ORF type:complete len:445 (+),score=124.18 TRINITY_DN26527_c0_g1_i1:62-1396(+)